jgi:hypothetical protein
VSSAILGTILAQRLPGAISEQVGKVKLPPGFKVPAGASASNANSLLNPAAIAAAKAKLPPQMVPVFDQVIHAIRTALALTLHDLFLIAIVLIVLALVASLLLPDVPLRSRRLQPAAAGETPAAEGDAA